MKALKNDNAVIREARRRGLVVFENDRIIKIKCPFSNGQKKHYAIYRKPTVLAAYGTFACAVCKDKDFTDLLEFLGLERYEARSSKPIYIDESPLFELINRVENVLSKTGRFFVMGTSIVRVLDDSTVSRLDVSDASKILSNLIVWIKKDNRCKPALYREIDPPLKIINILCGSSEHEQLDELIAVARQPLLDSRGYLLRRKGYDKKSRLFAHFYDEQFEKFWFEAVDYDDACVALREVVEWLSEFQFAEKKDLSAVLASLLTCVIRHDLPAAPMFLVTASSAGTGKSILCELIGTLAAGKHIASSTWPLSEDEAAKYLVSQLRNSPSVVYFDNVEGTVKAYPSICTCLSQSAYEGRELGKSVVVSVGTRSIFLMSGNFLCIEGDLRRRTIPILLASLEHPEKRKFKRANLIQDVINSRPQIVMSLLKIIAAYRQARNGKLNIPPLAGFAEWSKACREPLVWLGLPDPLERLFEQLETEDIDRAARYQLLKSLFEIFGTKRFRARDVERIFKSGKVSPSLYESLDDLGYLVNDRLNVRKFGWGLSQLNNQVIKNYVLRRVGSDTTYRIECLLR